MKKIIIGVSIFLSLSFRANAIPESTVYQVANNMFNFCMDTHTDALLCDCLAGQQADAILFLYPHCINLNNCPAQDYIDILQISYKNCQHF